MTRDVAGPLSPSIPTAASPLKATCNTSHGTVDTKVVQSIDFNNGQKLLRLQDGSVYDQYVGQIDDHLFRRPRPPPAATSRTNNTQYSWPLGLRYAYTANPDGSWVSSPRKIHQGFSKNVLVELNGTPTYSASYSRRGFAYGHAERGSHPATTPSATRRIPRPISTPIPMAPAGTRR